MDGLFCGSSWIYSILILTPLLVYISFKQKGTIHFGIEVKILRKCHNQEPQRSRGIQRRDEEQWRNKRHIWNHWYTRRKTARKEPFVLELDAYLTLECSSLNSHLFRKNIIESPSCSCGGFVSNYHYLLLALNTQTTETDTYHTIFTITQYTTFFTAENLSEHNNESLFLQLQEYIIKSGLKLLIIPYFSLLKSVISLSLSLSLSLCHAILVAMHIFSELILSFTSS